MYMSFYELRKAPFHITPDPTFLFLTPSHKEALGAIIYCIEERKGFAAVVGEVGTGKTTIARSYLAKVNRNKTKPIFVFNAAVSIRELLLTILKELGVPPEKDSVYELVEQLHLVLIKEYRRGRNIVLIVDEAQNMPVATLEELRVLSNLETLEEKLLQIILIGQPELAKKLNRTELRQLKQRLAVRANLLPLTEKESRDYIMHRLSVVRDSPRGIFSNAALRRIVKYAQGSPRKLNIICDNSLIAGFGYKKKRISGKLVRQVIEDYDGVKQKSGFDWKVASVGTTMVVALVALGLSVDFLNIPAAVKARIDNGGEILNHKRMDSTPKPAAQPLPVKQLMEVQPIARSLVTKEDEVAQAGHEELSAEVQIMSSKEDVPEEEVVSVPEQDTPEDIDETGAAEKSTTVEAAEQLEQQQVSEADQTGDKFYNFETVTDWHDSIAARQIVTIESVEKREPERESEQEQEFASDFQVSSKFIENEEYVPDDVAEFEDDVVAASEDIVEQAPMTTVKTRTVRQGESLSQILMEIYGYVDGVLISRVQQRNPQIDDADLIYSGDAIFLPEATYSK